jgi:site-specific DNA recombinase
LASGRVRSLVEIARSEGLTKRYVTRLIRLAFVSPAFAEAIAEGVVPTSTNLQMLMDGRVDLPLSWNDQEQLFTD